MRNLKNVQGRICTQKIESKAIETGHGGQRRTQKEIIAAGRSRVMTGLSIPSYDESI